MARRAIQASACKGIVFDLDNTLYQYLPAHLAALRASHKAYPIKQSFSSFEARYKRCVNDNERALFGTGSSHNRLLYFQRMLEADDCFSPQLALRLYHIYWDAFITSMKLDADVRSTLIKLVRTHKLGILSDLTADVQLEKVSAHRLWPFFDAIVTSEEAGAEKPSTKGLRLLLRKMRLRAKDVVFVGDNPINDGLCANRAGIRYIQIIRTDMAGSKGAQPWRRIRKISELLKILAA